MEIALATLVGVLEVDDRLSPGLDAAAAALGVFEGRAAASLGRVAAQLDAAAASLRAFVALLGVVAAAPPVGAGVSVGGGGGSMMARLPHLAGGGSVERGGPVVVGEHGPELFVPGAAGAVLPNSGLGGGALSVNVVVRGEADAHSAGAAFGEALAARLRWLG